MRRVAMLSMLLWLGPGVGAAWARPSKTEASQEGKILVVRGLDGGAAPQLTADNGQAWLLTGLLKDELVRLDGHKLKAWGVLGDKKMGMVTMEVSRYDITDSGGGRRPVVGLLRRDPAAGGPGVVLEREQGDPLRVRAGKALLGSIEKRVGCKIWLVGDTDGQVIKAFKFGWLSCNAPPTHKTGKESKK